MNAKLKSLIRSRRFWVAVMGVLIVIMQDAMGLTPHESTVIAGVLMVWIVGDSLSKTE